MARESGAADVHLHALPAAKFLRADEPKFCRDRQGAGKRSKAVCEDASVERELRSEIRYAAGAAQLWRRLHREFHEGDVRALGFCGADGARTAQGARIF